MPQNAIRVGVSNAKGFTPMGEKHLPVSSVEGKIPCQLTGKGIDRPTIIYVRPGRVRLQMDKYQQEKQTLTPPRAYDLSAEPDFRPTVLQPVVHIPVPRPPRNSKCRPVICLNSGRFFDSGTHAAKHYGLSSQLVNMHLTGISKQAKGRRFRFATAEEIMEADKDIHWTYAGELLPLVTGKRNF